MIRVAHRVAVTAALPFLTLPFLMMMGAPRAAQAQLRPSHRPWEVSFFGGGSFVGDRQYPTDVVGSAQTTSRTVGLRYGSGYMVGGSVTENRWRHVGATFEYTFSNQPIAFTNLVDQPQSLGLSHSVHRVAYDLLYYPLEPSARLRPYVFVGPGLSLFRMAQNSIFEGTPASRHLSDPWKFSVNWGGGIKYLVVDHWAASIQFEDSVSGVPRYGLNTAGIVAGAAYVPGFQPSGFLHQKMVGIGLIYQWDGR